MHAIARHWLATQILEHRVGVRCRAPGIAEQGSIACTASGPVTGTGAVCRQCCRAGLALVVPVVKSQVGDFLHAGSGVGVGQFRQWWQQRECASFVGSIENGYDSTSAHAPAPERFGVMLGVRAPTPVRGLGWADVTVTAIRVEARFHCPRHWAQDSLAPVGFKDLEASRLGCADSPRGGRDRV